MYIAKAQGCDEYKHNTWGGERETITHYPVGLKQTLQSLRDITYRKKDTFAAFLLCISPRREEEERREGFFFLRLRRRLLQILKWAEKCLLLQHRILLRVNSGMGRRGVKAELSCRSKHPSLRVRSPVFVGVGLDYFIRNHSWNNVVLRVLVIRWIVNRPPAWVPPWLYYLLFITLASNQISERLKTIFRTREIKGWME